MGQGYVVGGADNIPLIFSDYVSCHSDEGGNAHLAFICSRKPPTAYAGPAPAINIVLFNRRGTQRETQSCAEYHSLRNSASYSAKLCG